MSKKSKVSPAAKVSARGQLSKLSKITIPGNKQVPIVLRAIFSNYDVDASGSISKKEMAALVMDLQSLLPGTPAHLKHCANVVSKIAMAALDIDGGGTIDEDEFVEWCQSNLFLTAEDRATMLVSNMDLSQFITALEMCVKMQLAGIGPYNYYTPPPPTCTEKWCTTKLFRIWCALFWFVFIITGGLVFLFVILPILPGKKTSRTKQVSTSSPAPAGEAELSSTPAAERRQLVRNGLRPESKLQYIQRIPENQKWDSILKDKSNAFRKDKQSYRAATFYASLARVRNMLNRLY